MKKLNLDFKCCRKRQRWMRRHNKRIESKKAEMLFTSFGKQKIILEEMQLYVRAAVEDDGTIINVNPVPLSFCVYVVSCCKPKPAFAGNNDIVVKLLISISRSCISIIKIIKVRPENESKLCGKLKMDSVDDNVKTVSLLTVAPGFGSVEDSVEEILKIDDPNLMRFRYLKHISALGWENKNT